MSAGARAAVMAAEVLAVLAAFPVLDWWNRRANARQLARLVPTLDCGCMRTGRPEYFCMRCDHSRCDVHRDQDHVCTGPCPECRHIRRGEPTRMSAERHADWHKVTGYPLLPL